MVSGDRFQSTGAAAAPRRARAMPPAAPAPSTPGDDLAAAAAALDAISLPGSGRRAFLSSSATCAHGACTAHGRTPALSRRGVRAPYFVARAQKRAGKARRSGRRGAKKEKMRSDALTPTFRVVHCCVFARRGGRPAAQKARALRRGGSHKRLGGVERGVGGARAWDGGDNCTGRARAKGEKFVPISTPRQPVTHLRVWFSDIWHFLTALGLT